MATTVEQFLPWGTCAEYFFVTFVMAQPFQAGEVIATTKPSCDIHTILDGLDLEISGVGHICSVDNYEAVVKSVNQLFFDWRVENK